MILWLFFVIFGLVLFLPAVILFFIYMRFKSTIVLIVKKNGTIIREIITEELFKTGQIEILEGKHIKPIKLFKEQIRYGKWRRWYIIDLEKNPPKDSAVTDKDVEKYFESETMYLLLLFGKLKDLLLMLLYFILGVGATTLIVVIYFHQTQSAVCVLNQDNVTMTTLVQAGKIAINATLGG